MYIYQKLNLPKLNLGELNVFLLDMEYIQKNICVWPYYKSSYIIIVFEFIGSTYFYNQLRRQGRK